MGGRWAPGSLSKSSPLARLSRGLQNNALRAEVDGPVRKSSRVAEKAAHAIIFVPTPRLAPFSACPRPHTATSGTPAWPGVRTTPNLVMVFPPSAAPPTSMPRSAPVSNCSFRHQLGRFTTGVFCSELPVVAGAAPKFPERDSPPPAEGWARLDPLPGSSGRRLRLPAPTARGHFQDSANQLPMPRCFFQVARLASPSLQIDGRHRGSRMRPRPSSVEQHRLGTATPRTPTARGPATRPEDTLDVVAGVQVFPTQTEIDMIHVGRTPVGFSYKLSRTRFDHRNSAMSATVGLRLAGASHPNGRHHAQDLFFNLRSSVSIPPEQESLGRLTPLSSSNETLRQLPGPISPVGERRLSVRFDVTKSKPRSRRPLLLLRRRAKSPFSGARTHSPTAPVCLSPGCATKKPTPVGHPSRPTYSKLDRGAPAPGS